MDRCIYTYIYIGGYCIRIMSFFIIMFQPPTIFYTKGVRVHEGTSPRTRVHKET